MAGFFSNQASKKKSIGPIKHGRERLDWELPDVAHTKVSEWSFCTSSSLVNASNGNQIQPNQVESVYVLGGTRWQPVVFAYQINNGTTGVEQEFTTDLDANVDTTQNPCVRTIMPLNVLWSPYSRVSGAYNITDSIYSAFTERIWPYGLRSLFTRYKYVRVRKCFVTLQFTNWSRESFNGMICINRNDVEPNGVSSAVFGSATARGRQPKSFYNSIAFTVHGNNEAETLNPSTVAEYNSDTKRFQKPRITYVRFEVDMRHLFADLEWTFDAMSRDTVDSNFWYSFSSYFGADKPRPNVIGYYQILLNRKFHGDDSTSIRGPTVAIRHTWECEFGRDQAADDETATYSWLVS